METKILNFNTISQGKMEVYCYRNGLPLSRAIIMGFMNSNITYADTIPLVVYTQHTSYVAHVDVITLVENETDYLKIVDNNKIIAFITTSKATLMEFMRKEIVANLIGWNGKLNKIKTNMQRKNMGSEWYHELVKQIKNL